MVDSGKTCRGWEMARTSLLVKAYDASGVMLTSTSGKVSHLVLLITMWEVLLLFLSHI